MEVQPQLTHNGTNDICISEIGGGVNHDRKDGGIPSQYCGGGDGGGGGIGGL